MWYNLFIVGGPAGISRDSSVDAEAVRRQVDSILASPGFGATERRGRLLRYLVEKALAGEPVKEYGIGVDVFDKPIDYDPRLDPSVRVEIGRLRARLSDYYSMTASAPILIEISKGSYAPVFETKPPVALVAEPVQQPREIQPPHGQVSRWMMAAFAGVLLLATIWLWRLAPSHGRIESIVVLPFANLTGDSRNDYLADGATEQLTDALSQVSTLRVVARTSAFQFKGKNADIREIGRKVNADAVIEGSILRIDQKLRLTVQINRSRDGYHIFSRVFEGSATELGRLENEMTAPVISAVRPGAAVAKKPNPDPRAYDLFLKARAYRGDGTRAASDQAIAYLHQAIERDPRYADAYAALAGVYSADALNLASDPIDYANQAKAAAEKALDFDPQSSAAYAALGSMDSLVLLDWKRGEQELRKAVALMPQSAFAHGRLGLVLSAQGRFSEAIPELQKAADLDPLVAAPAVSLGLVYFMSRNYDEALRRFTEARDLHPEVVIVHAYIGLAYEAKGQVDQAMQEYKIVEAKSPDAARVFTAHLLAATGARAEAMALLKRMEQPTGEPPNAFDIAAVYAALGDKDSAFQWLDQAYQRRIVWFLKVHPFLDSLRGDPRFGSLLRKAALE